MLETELINKFNPNYTYCYNHFLTINFPHPMLLWINLLYSRQHDLKWLPCYLDVQTELGSEIMRSLIKHKLYHILLFTLNNPQQYQEILKVSITQEKCQQLDNFWHKSISWKGKAQPEVSKQILKQKFAKVKAAILKAIAKTTSN
jgi:serine/threonine-protein kinase